MAKVTQSSYRSKYIPGSNYVNLSGLIYRCGNPPGNQLADVECPIERRHDDSLDDPGPGKQPRENQKQHNEQHQADGLQPAIDDRGSPWQQTLDDIRAAERRDRQEVEQAEE